MKKKHKLDHIGIKSVFVHMNNVAAEVEDGKLLFMRSCVVAGDRPRNLKLGDITSRERKGGRERMNKNTVFETVGGEGKCGINYSDSSINHRHRSLLVLLIG